MRGCDPHRSPVASFRAPGPRRVRLGLLVEIVTPGCRCVQPGTSCSISIFSRFQVPVAKPYLHRGLDKRTGDPWLIGQKRTVWTAANKSLIHGHKYDVWIFGQQTDSSDRLVTVCRLVSEVIFGQQIAGRRAPLRSVVIARLRR